MGRDGLDLSISLETILAQLPAGPGLLEAAKGSHRREHIVAVHPENNNICTIYAFVIHYQTVQIRGVMTPTPESESESDFHNSSEIFYSDSNSNSGKKSIFYCTGIDSKIGYR